MGGKYMWIMYILISFILILFVICDIDIIDGDNRVPRKADLRAFVLMADEPLVWRSGLTRFSRNPDSFIVNSSQGGGFKDTWVLSR